MLPCGAGKTLVGAAAMAEAKATTLILVTNTVAGRQWKRELIARTSLTEEEIGEYSGERKEIRPVTIATYQVMTTRRKGEYRHLDLFDARDWGLIVYDEVHLLPAPIFRLTADLQSRRRLGLTATLVREDGREGDVFSLIGPKRYDAPWKDIEAQGWIAPAECIEVRVTLTDDERMTYATAEPEERYRIAATAQTKLPVIRRVLERHPAAASAAGERGIVVLCPPAAATREGWAAANSRACRPPSDTPPIAASLPLGERAPPMVDVGDQLGGEVVVEARVLPSPVNVGPAVHQHEQHRPEHAGPDALVHVLLGAEIEEEADQVRTAVQQVEGRVPAAGVLAVAGRQVHGVVPVDAEAALPTSRMCATAPCAPRRPRCPARASAGGAGRSGRRSRLTTVATATAAAARAQVGHVTRMRPRRGKPGVCRTVAPFPRGRPASAGSRGAARDAREPRDRGVT